MLSILAIQAEGRVNVFDTGGMAIVFVRNIEREVIEGAHYMQQFGNMESGTLR